MSYAVVVMVLIRLNNKMILNKIINKLTMINKMINKNKMMMITNKMIKNTTTDIIDIKKNNEKIQI